MLDIKHQINIDLSSFVKNGQFDFIELGMSMDEVQRCFPAPDTYEGESLNQSKIWKYGSFELFFEDKSLYMIFTDDFAPFYGGDSLEIKSWDLSENLILQNFLERLNSELVNYSVSHNENLNNTTVVVEGSGVELLFELDKGKCLSAIWKKKI